MPIRDPKLNPFPGDVFTRFKNKGGTTTRSITDRIIKKSHLWIQFRDEIGFHLVPIGTWRNWATLSKVIHRKETNEEDSNED